MADELTQGRRRPDETELHELEPGDYARWGERWWICTPSGLPGTVSTERGWSITEHEDGTITVSPSILVRGAGAWHGYLERGVWRAV